MDRLLEVAWQESTSVKCGWRVEHNRAPAPALPILGCHIANRLESRTCKDLKSTTSIHHAHREKSKWYRSRFRSRVAPSEDAETCARTERLIPPPRLEVLIRGSNRFFDSRGYQRRWGRYTINPIKDAPKWSTLWASTLIAPFTRFLLQTQT